MGDDLFWLEALDRAYLACEFFIRHVAEHPVVQSNDQLRTVADEAHGKLYELYRLIGALDPDSHRELERRGKLSAPFHDQTK